MKFSILLGFLVLATISLLANAAAIPEGVESAVSERGLSKRAVPTIESAGLKRKKLEKATALSWMRPFLTGRSLDMQHYKISNARPLTVAEYAVGVASRSYLVESIDTKLWSLDIKARNILLDNYR